MTGSNDPQDPGSRDTQARRQGLAYQGAIEAVFAILIAAGLGYWADTSFGTSPWLLVTGLVLGFTAFVLRLLRLGRQLEALPPRPESRDDL